MIGVYFLGDQQKTHDFKKMVMAAVDWGLFRGIVKILGIKNN
jgi:hypothetical protein